MYNPGGDYLTYIKDSIIRKPRSKIVVDGKTYTGLEHLVSFPKITHETEKMIGGFPAKTCEFEIYNLDGKLSLNGKEVQVYRGLDISDTKTVWIPMGLFYADGEDVTNNSTKRTIQFKGTDRTRLFDSPFANVYSKGIIPADTVISTVAEKICAKHGLSINTATKSKIISYRFTEAVGTPEDTTDRQVIAWIAELSGCIPIISRDGQSLMFTRPTYKETVTEAGKTYPSGSYADKRKYKTLSAEPLYGPINAISFGHADYDDAYVYQDDTDVETNGLHEWKINDNALVENDKSALAPKVFAIIKGMQIYPFELTDFIDDYLFDINDGIQIKKKDGAFVTTYVLGMKTTSRIRSVFKAGTQDSSSADRNLAGSVKLDMKKVKLSVDHINNQITALVKETDEKYSKLTQTVDGFEIEIANTKNGLEAKIEATAKSFEATYAKRETVDGQIKGITDQLEGIDGKIEGKVTTEMQKDTTISILAGKVESKISGNYVTKATYDDEKKNWLLKTTYDSYVKQTDQQISAAVSKVQKLEEAGYITKAACNSLIDQKSDSIALTVESNLKYESRNLLMDSECFEHLTPTGYHATYQGDYVSTDATYLPSGKARKLTVKANDDSQIAGVSFSPSDTVGGVDKIKPNTTYTLSFWARLYPDDATQSLSSQASVYTATAPNNAIIDTKRTRGLALTKSWQKVVIVFTTQSTVSSFLLRFALAGCVNGQQYAIGISSLKLEIGNVATEWATRTPSAAEVEEYAKSEIAQLPDRITLSVEKNLKIGARNILLDSACFKSFTPSGFYSGSIAALPYTDSSLPSGSYKRMSFTTTRSDSCGVQFDSVSIIGQALGSIDKIKPSTTYTLSFWLKSSSHNGEKLDRERMIYCGENNFPTFDGQRCKIPTISSSWQKYVVVFNTSAAISEFRLRFCILACTSGESIAIDISSLKLEEGTIATDWTPSENDLVSGETYQSFINLLPDKITAGVSSTVTDQYVADKIHSKCVSVTLDTNGVTVENGALTLKDESGDVMIDSSGIHSEYLNFGKMIDLDTIKNGTYFSTIPYGTTATKNIDIWTLRNYTGTDTGMKNAKAAVDVMTNIPKLKPLFWNNSNNWFCSYGSSSTDTNYVIAAKLDNIDEAQTYLLSYDIILASVANGKGLIPQKVFLATDKSVCYDIGVDTLTAGNAVVSGKTYQYRYGTLSCSIRGYDLIKKKGGQSKNAKITIQILSLGDGGTGTDSTSWFYAMHCPNTSYMGFIGNIKIKTFVGATLNARALLNSNTDYFLDLGTGVLSADEVGCTNLRATALPSVLSATDNLRPVYVDEETGQLYRLA
ncbi:uncharacterized protein BN710_00479 [Ruminococcus sp. CAG:563]|nr:uncharacterized protein BN710_00479 [Ruminococcus sp. CAG:563]